MCGWDIEEGNIIGNKYLVENLTKKVMGEVEEGARSKLTTLVNE